MEEQRKAVRAMQEYIREHITEDITPADLAKASNFSPWYARKLFIKHLGTAPAVYIRCLRLSMSALRLRDEEITILDIAMEMGFGSVDGYQRAFRREFGCNPKEYALSPVPIWLFTPYLIEDAKGHIVKYFLLIKRKSLSLLSGCFFASTSVSMTTLSSSSEKT